MLRPTPRVSAVWAAPASLAATRGISVDFFSSGYLDVSVPRVGLPASGDPRHNAWGVVPFGIPRVKGWSASPWIVAASRVLRRRPVPRHPPRANKNYSPNSTRLYDNNHTKLFIISSQFKVKLRISVKRDDC